MLPQLEEPALLRQFKAYGAFEGYLRQGKDNAGRRRQRSLFGQKRQSVPLLMRTQLEILRCPSDPSVNSVRDDQSEWESSKVAVPCLLP